MEHVVFFSEPSGDAAFRRVSDLEEAVRLVESLRNERGITDVALHALTPVPVSFRTYYHVEVGVEAPVAQSAPVPEAAPSVEVPALHLLPPPAVEVEQVEALEVAADIESPAAELTEPIEIADEQLEQGEQPEQPEQEEQGDSLAAFSPELLREAEGDEAPQVEAVEIIEAVEIAALDVEADGQPADEQPADEEPADEFVAFGSHDALVPEVRPEPEVERSLGYFAR